MLGSRGVRFALPLLIALGIAPAASAAPKPFLDTRTDHAPAAAASTAKARAQLRTAGAKLSVDPTTGTLRSALGPLSRPAGGDRTDIAAGFVRSHLAAIGLGRDDLGSLHLAGRTDIPGGAVQVAYDQYADGIPVFGGGLRVTVDRDGRVIALSGGPEPGIALPSSDPALSARAALGRLMDDVGAHHAVDVATGPRGVQRTTVFDSGEQASLVAFDGRLGWLLDLRARPAEHYAAVVDATTGAILYRANRVRAAANDASVWDQYPGAVEGGTQHTVDLTPYLNAGATDLSGPYAHAWADLNDNDSGHVSSDGHIIPLDTPDAGEAVPRTGSGDFVYPFSPFSATSNPNGGCSNSTIDAPQCSWDYETNFSYTTDERQNAVQAFYYVNHYRDHLFAPPISFSPADGNFDDGDRILVNSDDGAATGTLGRRPDNNHIDNAYMDTPPNGTSPTMAMFLFGRTTAFREANGGDDASVVYHEYTHGLSSRLITVNPSGGEQALNTAQAGAMGEAWSDWYAKDFVVDEFPSDDTSAPGEVDMGNYVDLAPHTIRSQALDCPVGAAAAACPGTTLAGSGGYTYSDLGKVANGNEVHADGEIWGETLWDLRDALGSQVAEAIITQGMRLTPPEPTFLDARSAIIAADTQLFPFSDHSDALWTVFAHRGMGWDATSVTTGGGTISTATDGFKVPPSAVLSANPASPVAGKPVTLDASSSVDHDGSVVSYDFDFDGNGVNEISGSTSPKATTTYAAAGTVHPIVTVHDNEGQVDTAAISLTVQPAPVVTPTPTPTVTPTVTPTPTPGAGPKVAFAKTGKKGRTKVTVTCTSACSGKVTVTIQPKLAKKLGLGKKRTIGTGKISLKAAGKKTFTIKLTAKALKGMKKHKVKTVTTRVAVTVRDAKGQGAKPSRNVRISR